MTSRRPKPGGRWALLLSLLLWVGYAGCARFNAQGGLFLDSFLGFLPFTPLNSIQTGNVTLTSTSHSVSLTPVNPFQTFVYCFGHAPSSSQSNITTCRLNSAEQLVIEAGAGNNQNVRWGVVEFARNAFVQHGTASLAAGESTKDVSVSFVNLDKTFLIVESRTGNVDMRNQDEVRTLRATLTSATNLRLERADSAIAIDVTYQVIQLNSATVRSGVYSLSTQSADVALVSPLDLSRSVIFFTVRASADTDGVDNRFYVRGRFSAADTITFARAGTAGTADISYFAVEFNGVSVQSGTASTALHTETSLDATLTSAVDPARTVPIISNTIVDNGLLTSDSDQDSGRFSAEFTSSTNLRFTRAQNEDRPANIDYFTLQF